MQLFYILVDYWYFYKTYNFRNNQQNSGRNISYLTDPSLVVLYMIQRKHVLTKSVGTAGNTTL